MKIKATHTIVAVVTVCALTYFFTDSEEPVGSDMSSKAALKDPAAPSTSLQSQKSISDEALNRSSVASSASAVTTVKNNSTKVFEQPDDNPNFETFHDRYQGIVARRAGLQFDPEELYREMQKSSAWEEMPDVPKSLNLTEAEKNDGRMFIELSTLKLESLMPGDTLKISIDNQDVDFMATISDVRSDGEGKSVTWWGESSEPNYNGTITITQAEGLTVGGIFTDQGLYQLEVKDGHGYIVSSATLFRHGVDGQVVVPQDLIDNPPDGHVDLQAETFGDNTPQPIQE